MEAAAVILQVMITALATLLLPYAPAADPRARIIELTCAAQTQENSSIYIPNFFATMESVGAQMRNSGFGTAVTGSGHDSTYGLGQCYGDLSTTDCALCYAEARTNAPRCRPRTGGRIYLDGCFVRFENYDFYDEYTGRADRAVCTDRAQQGPTFAASARKAVSEAVSAAHGNNGYGRAEVAVAGAVNESVYVLTDCWRTVNASGCRACLENASATVTGCLPSSEGRALNTGCFIRYSDTNFLNPKQGNGGSRGIVIAIVIASTSGAAALITLVLKGIYLWRARAIRKRRKGDAEELLKILNHPSLSFEFSTLEKATGGFDKGNELGRGGFGTVYKGVLADGREIAVKRLFFDAKHRASDFYNEVNMISSIEHKNLVRLLGCSCSGPESLLVYEYMPNQSLDRFIFDSDKGKTLKWEKRMEISKGIAEGLVYLHEKTETRIIHRDIKASNILLDYKNRAKIADFGLARSFQEDESHISTAIAGTLGYMAPEYLSHGNLTEKVDVYSFGVLLLEIVTGRPNNACQESESLITSAWRHYEQGIEDELFDPNLMLDDYESSNVRKEIRRAIRVGLLCTQEIVRLRPIMSKALRMLEGREEVPTPTNPPFLDEKTMEVNATMASSVGTISQSSVFFPR